MNCNLKSIAAHRGRVRHMTGCNLKWINVRNGPNNSSPICRNLAGARLYSLSGFSVLFYVQKSASGWP
jgi:hypothetical protein